MTQRSNTDILMAAEATLIGTVLQDRTIMSDLGMVTPAHFVDRAHSAAWKALLDDRTIDNDVSLQLAVTDLTSQQISKIMASRRGRDTAIRARDYISEQRRIREVRRIASEALTQIEDGTVGSANLIANLIRSAQAIDAAQVASLPANVVASKIHAKGNSRPISTGLASLDYVLHGGLHRGLLTGLFARYKHGKTLMTSTIAHNLDRDKVKTLVITLERRDGDVERFIVARCLNIDKQDLNLADPTTNQFWDEYLSADRSLHYLHRPGITIEELRSQIISAYYAYGIEAVFVDYWQLIRMVGGKESRAERQQESAQMLADLASELDIAIVVTGQLNQDGHPHGGEGVLASAGIVVRIQRPDNAEFVFFDTLVSNQGPERSKGTPNAPAAQIAQPGPHFEDYVAGLAE